MTHSPGCWGHCAEQAAASEEIGAALFKLCNVFLRNIDNSTKQEDNLPQLQCHVGKYREGKVCFSESCACLIESMINMKFCRNK